MNLNPANTDESRYRRDPQGFAAEQREAWEMRNPLLMNMLGLSELDSEQQASFFNTIKTIKLPDYLPAAVINRLLADPADPIEEYEFLGNRELLALALRQVHLSGPQERRDQVRRRVGLILRARRCSF